MQEDVGRRRDGEYLLKQKSLVLPKSKLIFVIVNQLFQIYFHSKDFWKPTTFSVIVHQVRSIILKFRRTITITNLEQQSVLQEFSTIQ